MKSTPEFGDRLADRREQRDRMRRGNARGLFGRMVASFLEQEVVLGPLAAIGDRRATGRELVPSPVDEPRPGSVHPLKGREIEDHAFPALIRGSERSARRLEMASGADDPFPSQ